MVKATLHGILTMQRRGGAGAMRRAEGHLEGRTLAVMSHYRWTSRSLLVGAKEADSCVCLLDLTHEGNDAQASMAA